MTTIQLNFTLRTSGNVKTVHLVGSWDNYAGQLPLSKDASKSGGWRSTFRFPATTLRQGQRHWYYYVLDGYHASHDPARESVVEPTTSRRLNVLDIPAAAATTKPSHPSPSDPLFSTRRPISLSLSIPQGRPLPSSSIVSPVPVKPGVQTRQIRAEQFSPLTMRELSARLASQAAISPAASPSLSSASGSGFSSSSSSSCSSESESEDEEDEDDDSDIDSDVPSLASSRSSRTGSPTSSLSSASSCSCERFGITRAGQRVRLDCGGVRCRGSDEEEEDEESCCEDESVRKEAVRRYRIVTPASGLTARQLAERRRGMVLRG